MNLSVFFIDAFTKKPFRGNPAAVCPLESWLSDEQMQLIAFENNLSETAFFVRNDDSFELRWFTPTVEVDLCGHATLASAYVLFELLGYENDVIHFSTKSGILKVSRSGEKITMDFPIAIPRKCEPPKELLANFNSTPLETLLIGHTYMVILENEEQVRTYKPDFHKLSLVDKNVNITARGDNCDFVSRFFAPNMGIPEDPVTGSAHCSLTAYWASKLNKQGDLHSIQLSKRSGEVFCRVKGDRVYLTGSAIRYMEGTIVL